MPPALLEEVFALNEELDEIREQREAGADAAALAARLQAARVPIERKREEHEQQIDALSAQWDSQRRRRRPRIAARRSRRCARRLLERNYINNLLATIEREVAGLGSGFRLWARALRSQKPKA